MAGEEIFGIPLNYLGAAGGALGAGGDIWSFFQQQQQRNSLRKVYDILSNPQKLAEYIQGLYQPMSGAANQAVQRDLGANWAAMTGGAPGGAQAQFVADALAKLETGRYQDVAQNAIRALTGATATADRYQNAPGGNLGNIMKQLGALKQIRWPTQQQTPGIVANPTWQGDPSGSEGASNPLGGFSSIAPYEGGYS